MFEATQDAIRKLLEQPDRLEWSLQGFGMLRAYLGSDKRTRLHIWDDRYAVDNVSTIHDHPWDFESLVLSGSIQNRIIGAMLGDPSHHVQRIVCGPGGCALHRERDMRVGTLSQRVYKPGQEYGQAADWLHESIPSRGAVTIVSRTFKEQTEQARVCFPIGTDWVSAEPRPATGDEVASIVGHALNAWGKP